jgi:hypothetical protein
MAIEPSLALTASVISALMGSIRLHRDETPEMRTLRRVVWLLASTAVVILLVAAGLVLYAVLTSRTPDQLLKQPTAEFWWAIALAGLGLFSLTAVLVIGAIKQGRLDKELSREQSKELQHSAEALGTELSVGNLIRFNSAQMQQYHGIATGQARSSYLAAQLASLIGLALLVTGGAIAIFVPNTTSKIITGALAGLGTGISGYIGYTFLGT